MKNTFNLDHEIQAWCQSIHTDWFTRETTTEELKDHLYCEIEQLMNNGLSDKDAFQSATQKLGTVHNLRKEHIKNLNLFSILTSDWSHYMSPQQATKWNTLLSLCVAITIVLSTLILELSPYAFWSQPVMYTLILLYIIPYTKLSHAATGVTAKEDMYKITQKINNSSNP